MAARAIWKGVLKIALVTVPIKVFPATESSDKLSFNQLHAACTTRISQKHWCASCGRDVPNDQIVKGFEFENGRYVVLLPEELEAVQPPSTRVIDLVHVAEASALELRAIDRAYYLEPDGADSGPAAHAYAVLTAALEGSVAIGKLAIYGREYLVAVSPQGATLMLYTLHHAAELREISHAGWSSVSRDELTLAAQVLHTFEGPLTLADFTDAYQADVRRLIDAKIAGDEVVVPALLEPLPVLALMDALTQSLAAATPKKKMAKARMTSTRTQAS
ncbi:MAG: Ku protein [Acidobacteriota bacterium]